MSMDPILVLMARAEARAMLFHAGQYEDLGEAVTPLLVYAHMSELDGTDDGVNAVLAIIRQAFGPEVADQI